MGDIVAFPRRRAYRPEVRGREVYTQPEPPDEAVWDMCAYTNAGENSHRCYRCPRWEEDPTYGPMSPGCYVHAAEATRVAWAWARRILSHLEPQLVEPPAHGD